MVAKNKIKQTVSWEKNSKSLETLGNYWLPCLGSFKVLKKANRFFGCGD